MATFVLVPGAFFGGWLWKRLTPLLWAAGYPAYPLIPTGVGDRSHLASPVVDLETHVTDLVNLLHYEDLHDAILVGHSYGGMVNTGAADQVPERVRRLVYLDALAPVDGESLADLRPGIPWLADQDETGRCPVPHPVEEMRDGLPDLTAEDAAWLHEHMTPHPAQALVQPVRFRNPAALAIPRTFILCQRNIWPEPPFADIQRAQTDPGWDYRELDADHVPMLARPRVLADLLLSLI
jgi:pimeloyl-ACP methyl ester carboxylesterase